MSTNSFVIHRNEKQTPTHGWVFTVQCLFSFTFAGVCRSRRIIYWTRHKPIVRADQAITRNDVFFSQNKRICVNATTTIWNAIKYIISTPKIIPSGRTTTTWFLKRSSKKVYYYCHDVHLCTHRRRCLISLADVCQTELA